MSAASAERSKAKQREVTVQVGEKEAHSFCPLHHNNPHNSMKKPSLLSLLSPEPSAMGWNCVCKS